MGMSLFTDAVRYRLVHEIIAYCRVLAAALGDEHLDRPGR